MQKRLQTLENPIVVDHYEVLIDNTLDREAMFFSAIPTERVLPYSMIFGLNGEGDVMDATARSLQSRPLERLFTTDAAGGTPQSNLMISGFTTADNGTVIYCNDANSPTVFSNTNIAVGVSELK